MIITNDFELALKIIDAKIRNASLEDLNEEIKSITNEIVGLTRELIDAIKEHDESQILKLTEIIEHCIERRNFYIDVALEKKLKMVSDRDTDEA